MQVYAHLRRPRSGRICEICVEEPFLVFPQFPQFRQFPQLPQFYSAPSASTNCVRLIESAFE